MLKISRSDENGNVALVLSGRIEKAHIEELEGLLHAEGDRRHVALDLTEVRLVDRETVKFLAACEARGIELKNCPIYIREWIETRSDRGYEPRC
jgi:hypothetical protein